MENFGDLCRLVPWASKLRKSYSKLVKVHVEQEKQEAFEKLLIRSVRIIERNVGDDWTTLAGLDKIDIVQKLLQQLIFILNEENSKMKDSFDNFDERFLPLLLKYVNIQIFNASTQNHSSKTMVDLVTFLKSLPHHPKAITSQLKRVRHLITEVHSKYGVEEKKSPNQPKEESKDAHMHSITHKETKISHKKLKKRSLEIDVDEYPPPKMVSKDSLNDDDLKSKEHVVTAMLKNLPSVLDINKNSPEKTPLTTSRQMDIPMPNKNVSVLKSKEDSSRSPVSYETIKHLDTPMPNKVTSVMDLEGSLSRKVSFEPVDSPTPKETLTEVETDEYSPLMKNWCKPMATPMPVKMPDLFKGSPSNSFETYEAPSSMTVKEPPKTVLVSSHSDEVQGIVSETELKVIEATESADLTKTVVRETVMVENLQITAEDAASEDLEGVEFLPPSPLSTSSSTFAFNSTRVSFGRCLVMPQGIIQQHPKSEELERSIVNETPERPEESDETTVVCTAAEIHAPCTVFPALTYPAIEGISPINWTQSGDEDETQARQMASEGNDPHPEILKPLHTTQDTIVPSIEGQVLPSLNVHSMHDFPVQLSAVRALLRKRFRNPFITPTEKQLFRVQRRLGRLKKARSERRWPEWYITSISVSPSSASPTMDDCVKESLADVSSSSLLTKEMDRSLNNLEQDHEKNTPVIPGKSECSKSHVSADFLVPPANSISQERTSETWDSGFDVSADPTIGSMQNNVHTMHDTREIPKTYSKRISTESGQKNSSALDAVFEKLKDSMKETTPPLTTSSLAGNLLGCSNSDSDAEFMEEIQTSVAAWVAQTESSCECDFTNGQADQMLVLPPLLAVQRRSVEASVEDSDSPVVVPSHRRSRRLASLPASTSSATSRDIQVKRKRSTPIQTGSGSMKVDNVVTWDELQKYLPDCWIGLLQQHVRDANASRQFIVTENFGQPCTITCQCSAGH